MAKKTLPPQNVTKTLDFSQGEPVVFKKQGTNVFIRGKFLCRMATNIIWVQDEHGRKFYLQTGDLCEKYVEKAVPNPRKSK